MKTLWRSTHSCLSRESSMPQGHSPCYNSCAITPNDGDTALASTKSLRAMVRCSAMCIVAMVLFLWSSDMDHSMEPRSGSIQWYQPPHKDSSTTTATGTMDIVVTNGNVAKRHQTTLRHWSDSEHFKPPSRTVRLLQTDSDPSSPPPKDKFRLIRNQKVSTLVSYLAMIVVFFAIFFCRLWDAVEAIARCLCCCRCPWLWQCLCTRSHDNQPPVAADQEHATSSNVVHGADAATVAATSLGTVRNENETHDAPMPTRTAPVDSIGV
jgi:hypothetical protein